MCLERCFKKKYLCLERVIKKVIYYEILNITKINLYTPMI